MFFSSFLKQSWLSSKDKARLLEWKGRVDLAMYASRRAPPLLPTEIIQYKPERQLSSAQDEWRDLSARISKDPEDGHASKLLRALARGRQVCQDYEQRPEFPIKGNMWLSVAHMGKLSLHLRNNKY